MTTPIDRERAPSWTTNLLSRREALQGLGAAGAVTLVASTRFASAAAQDASPAAADLESYPEIQIIARDFSFEMPAESAGGLTRLTLINEGEMDHHAMFCRTNDGVAAEDVEAALGQPDVFQLVDLAEVLGGPNLAAPGGGSATVILDLVPGSYHVICAIPDEEGIPHYMLGMAAPLSVTESDSSLAAPETDLTVELVDFGFDHLPAEIPAGPQIWEVMNVGQEPHELGVFRLAPGVPFDMVLGIFGIAPQPSGDASPEGESHDEHAASPETAMSSSPEAAMEASPAAMGPPFFTVTGTAPKSPGMTNWLVLDLEPGEHFVICFVPSPANGMAPHFALGMIMPFTAV
jgi:hypothetical protein